MNIFGNLSRFLYLFLIYEIVSVYSADVCVKKGPCTCEFSNGTGIDLTPSVKSSFITAQMFEVKANGTIYELSTYFYHPCSDAAMNVTTFKPTDTCNNPLSICRFLNTMEKNGTDIYRMDSGVYNFLGSSAQNMFSSNGDSIIYLNGPSKTIVKLVCAETDDKLRVDSLAEPNKICSGDVCSEKAEDKLLSFYSRNACLKQIEETGRSVGSTLLIIFFSLVIFYIVLGIGTKKFLMGATGIEVIPKLSFWTDLPNLVKDGWAFAISGFRLPTRSGAAPTSPDPNSYDSI